uniref:(northern house mosquito) hypothetical protein n=1 Tax=Culex pipiens TaxID=7175 RepID=A0A8D8BD26_CULPI
MSSSNGEPRSEMGLNDSDADLSWVKSSRLISSSATSSSHMGDSEWDRDLERTIEGDLRLTGEGLLIGECRLAGEDRLAGGEMCRLCGLGDRVRDRRTLRAGGESLRWLLRRAGLRSRVYRRGDLDSERRRRLLCEMGRDSRALEIGLSLRRDLGDGERRLARTGDRDRRPRGDRDLCRLFRRGDRDIRRLATRQYCVGRVMGDFDRERDLARSMIGGAGAGGMLSEPELTERVSWI